MEDSNLEKQFHRAMLSIYENALRKCGYRATYFLQMVQDHGGLQAAKTLLHKAGLQYGFESLWQCGCLDLTMEALILKPPWDNLFTEEEKKIARRGLKACDYLTG